jgi:ribosomal protein S18 acetylase RimI-like enzyme
MRAMGNRRRDRGPNCRGATAAAENVAARGQPVRARGGRPVSKPVIRPARKDESRSIAELFEIASDGVASYIWSTLQADYPGLPLLEIGRRRYERESTAFSYQNCLMAEDQGEVLGMMHAYAVEAASAPNPSPRPVDPVLKPYSELEAPGTLYIAAIAIWPAFRNHGVGRRFLGAARARAQSLGRRELSLLCFAGNTGARRFYDRAGFVVVDWRPVVPHAMIRHTGDVLLMLAPV